MADVVCLQEVTPTFLEWMLAESWVREHYFLSDINISPYGVLIASRKTLQPPLFRVFSLPSKMSRILLRAEYRLNDEHVCVGTFQLESHSDSDVRLQQLAAISPLLDFCEPQQSNPFSIGSSTTVPVTELADLSDLETDSLSILSPQSSKPRASVSADTTGANAVEQPSRAFASRPNQETFAHSFMLGDFGFDDTAAENKHVDSQYTDVWHLLFPTASKHNSETNPKPSGLGRVDRILVRSKSGDKVKQKGSYLAADMARLGTQSIGSGPLSLVFPSDHFGLLAKFDYRSQELARPSCTRNCDSAKCIVQ